MLTDEEIPLKSQKTKRKKTINIYLALALLLGLFLMAPKVEASTDPYNNYNVETNFNSINPIKLSIKVPDPALKRMTVDYTRDTMNNVYIKPLPPFPQGEHRAPAVPEPLSAERPDVVIETYIGEASHYTVASSSDRTASMEPMDDNALTCALPPEVGQGRFGMRVKVTNLANGLSVIVKYNDSGPFSNNRIIDLSTASQQAIGMDGIAQVKIELLHTEVSSGSWGNWGSGQCTQFVAEKVPIVKWRGNAIAWYSEAVAAAYKTSSAPAVGAILVTAESSYGHVAYVEKYNADGTILISEMNYEGQGIVSYRNVSPSIGRYIY
jgi:rare lipoprotein A (peptidoglycan hydrolase)